ncbi:MAG TPA: hypothetical protein PKC39_15890 [Ferruginibacter sp.]|nr:hypothetical protein [Ferruginibacter sp.]HMP22441.1 hypothetical protein [Ferruginibacter sp.]
MKLWRYSLLLSITSCLLLLIIFFLPDSFTVFEWTKAEVNAGVLFPVLLLSWLTALLGFAANNIFIDKNIVAKEPVKMSYMKQYIPTWLSLPGFSSFIWFIVRWYKGRPGT